MTADLAAVRRELDAARPEPPQERPPQRQYPELSHLLPAGQVLHYRADVYRQHFGEIFDRVDDLYARGLDAACNWQRSRPGPPAREGATVNAALQRLLTALVHDSPTRQHTLAVLRDVTVDRNSHRWWMARPGQPIRSSGSNSTRWDSRVGETIRSSRPKQALPRLVRC
ncbi:hypothetical protein [Catenuloplanes indicus]|uniref:Uncharacterized protein n=1 Tax=Catenuloplanes indicus TaxID=137267 RepID=A0AAE3VWV6_9ACTN|nr:hypothetical protein [Catenuloplanes indicus]MDQ0365082.1 hypothetical protein [Catenuloplanes indicus]